MRIFHDERFKQLSRPQPCGQWLWSYLLFGPRTIVVPGLIPVGLGTIADDLKWPTGGTRKAWQEIEQARMARADFDAPLIWLPRAIAHNQPNAANVCKAWARSLVEDVPECQLRRVAAAHLVEVLREGHPPSFLKAFVEALPEGFLKDIPEGFGYGIGRSIPDSETEVQKVHPDGSKDQIHQERADPARPPHPELNLRPVPAKAAKPKREADVHTLVFGFTKLRKQVTGLDYGTVSEEEWGKAKRFLRDVPVEGVRTLMMDAFIRTKRTDYPYDGSRTLSEFCRAATWHQIEKDLVENGRLPANWREGANSAA